MALFLGVLAQRDVLDEPVFDPTPVSAWTIVLVLGAVLGLFLLAVLAGCWLRSAREDPADRAFRVLAARMRLSRGARELVRTLASDDEVAPVGFLVSPSALRSGLERHQRHGPAARELGQS